MGRKKPTGREDENAAATQGGGGKSKKKNLVIEDDEYSVGTEVLEEQSVQEETIAPAINKKKGKKGNSKSSHITGDDNDIELKDGEEEDDVPVTQFGDKKKSKPKKSRGNSVFSSSNFGLLGEEHEDNDESSVVIQDRDDEGAGSEEENESVVAFTGKKKPSKSKKGGNVFSVAAFDAVDDADESGMMDNEDEPAISFMGKKKPSKLGKKGGGSLFAVASFDGLDEGGEDKDETKKDEDDAEVIFTGKKKKSSKSSSKVSSNSFSVALLDREKNEDASVSKLGGDNIDDDFGASEEDASVIMFSGKKKPSKKKSNSVFSTLDSGLGDGSSHVVEPEQCSVSTSTKEADDSKNKKQVSEDLAETSKNKKKKKKGGRTAQEEDDLDRILAELGEASSISKPGPSPSPPHPQEAELQTQSEPVGSADAIGEKETEEEAAAAVEEKQEKPEETKTKVPDKKVPKHVREMQERLAKLKEAEERKKREEKEKLRKEEEERLRQEELERLAEEKKRLKKEREKEKLLKKKQEGKLLTGKQKEEARRLEAMRNYILANAGVPPPGGDTGGAPAKRPKYQTKKSKPHPQTNGVAITKTFESMEAKENQQETVSEVDSLETEKIEEVEQLTVEKMEESEMVEENGIEEEDNDEEWDAKSWDDADLKLPGKSAFADEEDSEPEPVVKKKRKNVRPATRDVSSPPGAATLAIATPKVTSTRPVKSEDVESNKTILESGLTDKNKRKEPPRNKEQAKSDASSNHESNLRSPICCIMGHVDTGKTKLLDCIRGTNVQEGEAGGITQQIGATYFPAENIRERTKELKADAKLNVPGLLVIDTPGHESFSNLRSRGSGLCDIAILVVDIMHGLEPQTIESLNLLKMRNTEFIVALNKVDRLYGWKTTRNAPIVKAMKQQSKDVQIEFNMRLTQVITQFKEQGLNTELYYKNKEMGETFSIVPTSAISGEGIPDLLLLLVQWAQKTMIEKLTYIDEVQCTVLEVKVIEGHGTTIDVVLVNGVLHEGDQIVVCGMQGPIVTSIRALLTPHPMKELRVKGTYLHHKQIKAAQGIKITAQGLEHAIAGTALYVVGPDDDVEDIKESAMDDMRSVMSRIDKSGEGVYVQASTLGSLEALLEFLKTPAVNIPVSGIGIGPVHKKDVMKASVMLEKKKEFATILAFDVKVTPEARELSDELGVKIFLADIIYHLFDQFKAYIDNLKEEKKKEAAEDAVFPCVLKIMPNCIFNKKDPIVLGVDILEGIAKIGTPICIPQREFIDIGRIASIENNHKPVDYAKKGQKVAIKVSQPPNKKAIRSSVEINVAQMWTQYHMKEQYNMYVDTDIINTAD
ncbi:unnamed protein product [Ilex paraguariensis]|uniref:Eukaryotic translation initiation factor 5B n=1 Tax=Ilex paraguariensis TaxID=185542 RepID=A0ABC8QPT1_9AQUA